METVQDGEAVSSTTSTSKVISVSQKAIVTGLKVMLILETPK